MNIESERKEIAQQLERVNDIRLLKAIRNLIEFGLSKDVELEKSIDRGLQQSEKGEGREHQEVMKELRSRFKI